MSSDSLSNSSTKYLTKSLNQNDDGSEQSNGYGSSGQCTEDKSSIGSIEQMSIYESILSTRSVKTKISPTSTAVNSIDGKIKSSAEIADIETSTIRFKSESDSFNSHTHSNFDQKIELDCNKIIGGQLDGDSPLSLAEKEEKNIIACGTNKTCNKKRPTNNRDPIENLVSATLAFKEASHNQCDLLRAQTSAINRLAKAIEEQNVMMSRFHSVVQKSSTKNNPDDDGNPSIEDKLHYN